MELTVNSSVEKLDNCMVKVEIDVPVESINNAFAERYKEVANTVNIPGFRKGKAPMSLLEKKYGEEINNNLQEEVFNESLSKALDDNKLTPLTFDEISKVKDEVKVEKDKQIKYSISFEVKPEISFDNYKKIKLSKQLISISNDEINEGKEAIIKSLSKYEPIDTPAEMEDILLVTNNITVDNHPIFTDDKEKQATIYIHDGIKLFNLTSTELLPALKGVTKDATITFNKIKLPSDFPKKEFADKDASIEIFVNEVKRLKRPSTEEILKTLDLDSEKEFNEEVEQSIKKNKEEAEKEKMRNQIINYLVENADITLPVKYIEQQAKSAFEMKKSELIKKEPEAEKDEEKMKQLEVSTKEETVTDFKYELVIDYIAKKEKIYVLEDDVTAEIQKVAMAKQIPFQTINEYYENTGMKSYLRNMLKKQKTLDKLLEYAEIETKGEQKEKNDKNDEVSSKE